MDGVELPAIPVAGRLCLPWNLSFLGFLVVVRYSFLIIHAVDQVEASPPAMSSSSSFTPEHEQLLMYYLAWTLGFLGMLHAAISRQFSAPDAVGSAEDELSVSCILRRARLTADHMVDGSCRFWIRIQMSINALLK